MTRGTSYKGFPCEAAYRSAKNKLRRLEKKANRKGKSRGPKPYRGFPSKAAYRRAIKEDKERVSERVQAMGIGQTRTVGEPDPRTVLSDEEDAWITDVINRFRSRRANWNRV